MLWQLSAARSEQASILIDGPGKGGNKDLSLTITTFSCWVGEMKAVGRRLFESSVDPTGSGSRWTGGSTNSHLIGRAGITLECLSAKNPAP
jgi:hypothetical protein